MRAIAINPIRYIDSKGVQRTIAPGRRVPDELIDESLIDAGAIELRREDMLDDEVDGPAPKSPHKMTRDELDAVVLREGVQLSGATTNATIADAVVAHRLAQQQ